MAAAETKEKHLWTMESTLNYPLGGGNFKTFCNPDCRARVCYGTNGTVCMY